MNMIILENITKTFDRKLVLDNVSGSVQAGEIFTIIGPSGQGKTTLLRLINLLDTPDRGTIFFRGEEVHGGRSSTHIRRRMGMVFQTPIAFKETVFENIAIGLRYRGLSSGEIQRKVQQKLVEIGLEGYDNQQARTLSGGEMQRVSLARVMVTEPELLLLDEPTANLDPVSTRKIEDLIRYYNKEYGTTIIMSSHDLFQGQRLADRVAVMMEGRFVQTGDTISVFSQPGSVPVARFIGITNIYQGQITGHNEGMITVDIGGIEIHALSTITSGQVSVAIRPEDITLYNEPDGKMSARNVLPGEIVEIRPYGIISHVMIRTGSITIAVQVTWQAVRDMDLLPGKNVIISCKAPSVHIMPGEEISGTIAL